MTNELPDTLKDLVRWSVSLLGNAIREKYGDEIYHQIEKTRLKMKGLRSSSQHDLTAKVLNKEYTRLDNLGKEEQMAMAHSFSCMLELINRCESAYRSYRLNQQTLDYPKKPPHAIIFVLTAHPTEARSPEALQIFEIIQGLIKEALLRGHEEVAPELSHFFKIMLEVPLARDTKPKVFDEAKHIYNFALKENILKLLVSLKKKNIDVRLRTWVGGDKDGHPGVDEKTMLQSLKLSRIEILKFIKIRLDQVSFELSMMRNAKNIHPLKNAIKKVLESFELLKDIADSDGKNIVIFKKQLKKFKDFYAKETQIDSFHLHEVLELAWIFPALVLPLEIREDSAVVKDSLHSPQDFAIGRMLLTLKKIAKGFEARWYVRGFVLSMCESANDFSYGLSLSKKILGTQRIPVVPLFETQKALIESKVILTETFTKHPDLITLHREKWGCRFEVMLGYSDSSKESGVLPSRLLISNAMQSIDKTLSSLTLTPVFFHGSGGSVERGGGSLKEQTKWWPKSSLDVFKATIQGEMVARNFSSKNILRGQILKIANQANHKKTAKISAKEQSTLDQFAKSVQDHYRKIISDENFLDIVEKSSPYAFLSELKLGSRPSKRNAILHVGGLRAIPWILCWTQTRVLFPIWWGVGASWASLSIAEKKELKKIYTKSDLFNSFIKVLGFSLAKVELPIWNLYLDKSRLEINKIEENKKLFAEEFALCLKFYREITGEENLLWHRPWLGKSIQYRSPMIHPLNILQLIALKDNDMTLLRKTVTGIACGMLTTG